MQGEPLDLMLWVLLGRGAMQLSEALFANTTLRELDVTLNDIKGEGKDALLDAVDFSFAWCVSHITSSTCARFNITLWTPVPLALLLAAATAVSFASCLLFCLFHPTSCTA